MCGNGGSAADSEHIVGELMKGFNSVRPISNNHRSRLIEACGDEGAFLADHLQRALPTISLVSQSALITAVGNDVAADMIFAQQVYGYGHPGDVLWAMSTSGNSKNVIYAAQVAKAFGLKVIGLTGEDGGRLVRWCDVSICVPRTNTAEIQELCLPVYHTLCHVLEDNLVSPCACHAKS